MSGFVYLNEDSAFYAVFPQGQAPVKDTVTVPVKLIGSPETEAYMLDLTRCSTEQINQITSICAQGIGTVQGAALKQIQTIGMPIRKSQTNGVVS